MNSWNTYSGMLINMQWKRPAYLSTPQKICEIEQNILPLLLLVAFSLQHSNMLEIFWHSLLICVFPFYLNFFRSFCYSCWLFVLLAAELVKWISFDQHDQWWIHYVQDIKTTLSFPKIAVTYNLPLPWS